MVKIKYKRGTHVGVVLSFVVFVTFLIFLFSILEPVINIQQGKENVLNGLEAELIEYISSDLTEATISLNTSSINKTYDSGPPEQFYDCINISHIANTSISNLTVKNNEGKIVAINYTTQYLKINWTDNSKDFFKLYYTNESLNNVLLVPIVCTNIKEGKNYTIGLVKTDNYPFESKIIDLNNEYNINYAGLKQNLKMGTNDEFWFSFTNSSGITINPPEKNTSREIFAKEITIQYVDINADIQSGFINLRVW
ncbi:MAG: hypothetical protein ACE5ES_01985 [Candidatus Nanoarchaeia archaeon]